MNFGLIARHALSRAGLPIDVTHLELAKQYANDNIQELWYKTPADFRHSRDSVTTVNGSDEYVLNKLWDGFVPNTFRGPSANPRTLVYKDPIEFFRITRNVQDSTGDPNYYTFGDLSGVDKQIEASTQVSVSSSLASTGSGTVKLVNGSDVVESSEAVFSLNSVGLRLRKQGETRTYKIGEYLTSTKVKLDEKFRGVGSDSASYEIGDIGVHVSVQGFVGGQIDDEDIILDGSNAQLTTKTFSLITSVSKSEVTGGRIIAQNSAGDLTIATLAPDEMEIERRTVKLWRIPDSSEVINYRFYMKHPHLTLDSARTLIPTKYHRLLRDMTTVDLLEWADRAVPGRLATKLSMGIKQFEDDANDSSLWSVVPDYEGAGIGGLFQYDLDPDFL